MTARCSGPWQGEAARTVWTFSSVSGIWSGTLSELQSPVGFETLFSVNIALDAFEAGFEPLTGTGRYVQALLRSLGPVTAFHKHGHSVPGIALRCPTNRTVWSQLRLPAALACRQFDVVHVPGPRVPWLGRGKLVSTIHDLAFLKFPEMFLPAHRQRLEFFTRQAVKRSDRLIAVSECTKRDLQELLGAVCVDVVHHGVDHEVFRPGGLVTRREKPYILSVGALQPRKNFLALIRAYRQLRRPVELLIAGQRGWMWEEIERETGNGVVLLGHVNDEELPALYRGAAVVAMPSLYEGFGLPLLEALACGAPVVASNASCFPEVCGDAAILCGPNDWTDALAQALDHPPSQERSLKRAAEFTWERTAAKTREVYRKAIG
jgi:glycosyltransferase involved in cell wall biosynthesis